MSLLNNSIFLSTPPALSLDEIHSVAQKQYGLRISSEIVLLGSERDQNAIICADGKKLVFRITNCAESPDVTHLQQSALVYVQRTVPNFPIQHVVPTLAGYTEVMQLVAVLCGSRIAEQEFNPVQNVKLYANCNKNDANDADAMPSFANGSLV